MVYVVAIVAVYFALVVLVVGMMNESVLSVLLECF